jgi:type I site-specific restriction endonuclease
MKELYPHNRKALNELKQLMTDESIVALIQATGAGKSFVFMNLVSENYNDKKIAYVVPKWAIKDNLTSYSDFKEIESQVDFYSYNYFASRVKARYVATHYDLIVIDEAHHIASDIYGRYLYEACLMASVYKVKTLGMTATPIIVKEGKALDITKEFFNEKVVYGLSIEEGIEHELFPQVEYMICLTDEEAVLEKDVLVQLDLDASISYLENIVADNPKKKWLAYFSSIEDLEENQALLDSLLPSHRKFIVHSSTDDVYQTLKDFDAYEDNCIISSVDMLLEGMHINTVEGILLFRNVTSTVVFFQILGRLLSIGNKIEPLFVDITNSVKNIRPIPELLAAEERKTYRRTEEVKSERSIFKTTINSVKQEKLLDLIREKLSGWKEYRGVRWRTPTELGTQLGKSTEYVRAYKQYNPDATEEDIIDLNLNGDMKTYRSVSWRNDRTLSLALGKSATFVFVKKRKIQILQTRR